MQPSEGTAITIPSSSEDTEVGWGNTQVGLSRAHLYSVGALKHQEFILSQLWSQKSQIQVLAGPRSLWRLQGRVLPASPRSWAPGMAPSWLLRSVSACPPTLFYHESLLCVSLLTRTFVIGFRAHGMIHDSLILRSSPDCTCKDPFSK